MATLIALTIPKDYGYVLLTATASTAVSLWHATRIAKFRKAAEVPYPFPFFFPASTDYAAYTNEPESKKSLDDTKVTERYLFNCAQRAHGNFLEHYTNFLVALAVAGLGYPKTASIIGATYLVGRVSYAIGYTRLDKPRGRGRLSGMYFWMAEIGLIAVAGKVSVDFILKSLRS